MTKLRVRVQPGAKSSEVVGWREEVLQVRVVAKAREGRANEALVSLLAETLGVAKWRIAIVAGHSGRDKMVDVDGLGNEEVRELLQRPANGG